MSTAGEKSDSVASCEEHPSLIIPDTADSNNEQDKENRASYADSSDLPSSEDHQTAVESHDCNTGSVPESSSDFTTSQKQQRRDTYSLSPSVSTRPPCEVMAVCDGESLTDTGKSCRLVDRMESDDVVVAMETNYGSVAMETEPTTISMETTSKRRQTYSVSPQPAPASTDENSPSLSPLPHEMVTTPTSGSRKRRRTHSISPASSLLLSGALSVETGTEARVGVATEEPAEIMEDISSSPQEM